MPEQNVLGRGLTYLAAQINGEVMKKTIDEISAVADEDDLEIPPFLRRTKIAAVPVVEIVEPKKTALIMPGKIKDCGNEAATVKREADLRWRQWAPSAKQPNRPSLTWFKKQVRAERAAESKEPEAPANEPAPIPAPPKPEGQPSSKKKPVGKKPKADKPKKESVMRKTNATTKSKARTAMKKGRATKAVMPGTKLAKIVDLLTRAQGCTTADVLKLTRWPAVSMPQQARSAGLKLRKQKEGKITRYFAA